MAQGTHDHQVDPRNEDIQININGQLFRRAEAKISVFDSGFILGDGVWEGLRLHRGKILFAAEHMKRLYEGAKALAAGVVVSASLTKLNVGGNNVGSEGEKALKDVVKGREGFDLTV